ncbi:MAG: biotin/lipoate--protein ligase family protein [Hyphomicrobiales bacterium]
MHLPDPTFPPLLTGHPVKAPERAFDRACASAAQSNAGAGDVFWGRDTSRMDWAIILEPDVPAAQAQQMLMVAEVAFAESFGAIAPPEVGVHFRWPNEILINGAKAGGLAMKFGEQGDDGFPRWLVLGLSLNIRRADRELEPGAAPEETDLTEEGCAELDRTQLIESLSRHFLNHVHNWNEEGFAPFHELWMSKAQNAGEVIELEWAGEHHTGIFLTIDDEANLILKKDGGTVALPLAEFSKARDETA